MLNNQKGFTLIEMLVVLMIITILIFVAIPNINKHSKTIGTKGCEAFIDMVQTQSEAYEMSTNQYPSSINELVSAGYLKENQSNCPNGNKVVIGEGGAVSEVK